MMFEIGDRVKYVDNANCTLGDVLGTITDIRGRVGKNGIVKVEPSVTWDNGKVFIHLEEYLLKYEEKTEEMEPEASEHQKHLLAIYENAMFTDFTIICKAGGEEYKFPCHRAVLATNTTSGHFARMFEAGMSESSSGEVEVEGYDKEEVEHFIKYFYILKMEERVLEKHSVKFLKMADQYDVPMLKADVTKFLRSRLTKDTVLSTVLAAQSYNAPELKTAAIAFIVKMKNKVEEKSLAEWRLALKGHEDLLFDIFSAVYKK